MHDVMPLLERTDFPSIDREVVETLQVNLGYRCNQSCLHCHVNAGPHRKEMMNETTAQHVLAYVKHSNIHTLDLTGGAPELNPNFRTLVTGARRLGVNVIDRCNLTVLETPESEGLAAFLAEQRVEVIASLPCYLEQNVDDQRGNGVFALSLKALRKLNSLGYGRPDTGLSLSLVYNPLGPTLPPAQDRLEEDYKRELESRYGIVFNRLYTLTNMPIARFGSTLVSSNKFGEYMTLLRSAHRPENLCGVMCRRLLSVDYRGYVYDCDFNQMLGLPLSLPGRGSLHLDDLHGVELSGNPVQVADHCFGCTAGQGSSCGGALG